MKQLRAKIKENPEVSSYIFDEKNKSCQEKSKMGQRKIQIM